MKNSLTTTTRIGTEELDKKQYLASLLTAGLKAGMLTEKDIERLEEQFSKLLEKRAEAYCNGESTSLPLEKLTLCSETISFLVGTELKACENPDMALEALLRDGMAVMFSRGLERVRNKVSTCRKLHKLLCKKLFESPNSYYRSTVEYGVKGFFKLYCPEFAPKETYITADYPPCFGRPESEGIDFMEQYLLWIYLENEFLNFFSPRKIHELLYTENPAYDTVPMNLFEPVVLCALAAVILGKPVKELSLEDEDISRLYEKYENKDMAQIELMLYNAEKGMRKEIGYSDRVAQYMKLCVSKFALSIKHALEMQTLERVFLVS